mmetsp:Transcript_3674/g.12959  ORF Transcript_3674/g.12959 Transcript_3674/m.12959 type:complete len:247 (+) Transcript_3674:2332-3072(+)
MQRCGGTDLAHLHHRLCRRVGNAEVELKCAVAVAVIDSLEGDTGASEGRGDEETDSLPPSMRGRAGGRERTTWRRRRRSGGRDDGDVHRRKGLPPGRRGTGLEERSEVVVAKVGRHLPCAVAVPVLLLQQLRALGDQVLAEELVASRGGNVENSAARVGHGVSVGSVVEEEADGHERGLCVLCCRVEGPDAVLVLPLDHGVGLPLTLSLRGLLFHIKGLQQRLQAGQPSVERRIVQRRPSTRVGEL